MKKIYAKFTKERDLQFQIETAIYKDEDGTKVVEKRPLCEEAERHVQRMYDNYVYAREKNDSLLLPCTLKGKSVFFPYIKGRSLYDQIIEAAKRNGREEIFHIMERFSGIIDQLYASTVPFEADNEFIRIFGNPEGLEGQKAAGQVNIDLSFDNVIETEQGIRIFDYEWIFNFPVPVKFPVYRAIFAVFLKNAHLLDGVVEEDEIYRMFGITVKERIVFNNMNKKFMEYVEGGEKSYQKILSSYAQPELSLENRNDLDYAQVFWGCEGGFSEERAANYSVNLNETVKLKIEVKDFNQVDCVRIDPSNWPCMIQVMRLEVETDDSVYILTPDNFICNAMNSEEKLWIFRTQDPQILIPVQPEKGWKKIYFEYKLLYNHLENMEVLFAKMDADCERKISQWQEKAKDKQELAEGQARLLEQCAHTIADYEETIQLQKDKLSYIESTKAYQTFLKSKVEAIHLWDKLKEQA